MNFYRDNLVASSGTVGDWIDIALLPEKLGVTLPERLLKWKQMKKLGVALLDSSLEGRMATGLAPMNTIFNGYDDTVKTQAVLAILVAIDSIEQTVCSITGVFRERLNGIEPRDAVTNIQVGLRNSYVLTKQYTHQMDLIVNEILLDCLNMAKVVFKDGLTGTIILGDKYQKVFTALPEYFTISDHDIRITTSADVIKDLETVKSLIPEFVKSGGLPPDIILEAITSRSLPDLKLKVREAMAILKKENDTIGQLSLKLQETTDQLKQTSKQLEKAQQQIEELNLNKLQLEQQDMQLKYQLEWYKAKTDREYREATSEERKRRTDIEEALLADGNPYNDKIRLIGGLAL